MDRTQWCWIRLAVFVLTWLMVLAIAVGGPIQAQAEESAIHVVEIRGIVNPPVADYLERALTEAAAENARLVVVALDTPGGLDTSMREMTQAILASPVPVAVYIAPQGARAASAGLFILQAAHIAAMAPSTNTGSAHPVNLGGGETSDVMEDKIVHDAAATIRSLAAERDRNADWAERAVRESISVTAEEALELDVIDLVARDLDDLLQQLHGRSVETTAGEIVLDMTDAPRRDASMNFAERLLHVISNPEIAFLLLSVGSIALIAELYNPGALVPGITGAISLIFAFFALGNLPTNWAGVALILLAMVLLVAELNTDAMGILSSGAVIAFLLGGLLLFRPLEPNSPALPDLRVSPWLVWGATAFMGGFVLLVVGQVGRSRRSPLLTGAEQFVGKQAVVHQELNPDGRVRFDSQLWFARTRNTPPVPAGHPVLIVDIDGLTLIVESTQDGGNRESDQAQFPTSQEV